MTRVLFLDDNKLRHVLHAERCEGRDVTVVRAETYDEAVTALNGERFDFVSLDRDLNDFGKRSIAPSSYGVHELSGEDVANFIAEMPAEKRPRRAVVHSWNPDGARRMCQTLARVGIPTEYAPFSSPLCRSCGTQIAAHDGDNRETLICPETL